MEYSFKTELSRGYFNIKFLVLALMAAFIILLGINLAENHKSNISLYFFISLVSIVYIVNVFSLFRLKKLTKNSWYIYIWGILIPFIGYAIIMIFEYRKFISNPKNINVKTENPKEVLEKAFMNDLLTAHEYDEEIEKLNRNK